jgi:hypothetical protein
MRDDNQSGAFVFMISTRSGGVGLNLIGADTVSLVELDSIANCVVQYYLDLVIFLYLCKDVLELNGHFVMMIISSL